MDVGTIVLIVLIAVTAWIALFVIVLALCRAAAHADGHSRRSYEALRSAESRNDRYYAALR